MKNLFWSEHLFVWSAVCLTCALIDMVLHWPSSLPTASQQQQQLGRSFLSNEIQMPRGKRCQRWYFVFQIIFGGIFTEKTKLHLHADPLREDLSHSVKILCEYAHRDLMCEYMLKWIPDEFWKVRSVIVLLLLNIGHICFENSQLISWWIKDGTVNATNRNRMSKHYQQSTLSICKDRTI